MVLRCSTDSLYLRLLWTPRPVDALARPIEQGFPMGRIDIGTFADHGLIGIASLVPYPTHEVWEAAILVEDSWQGLGVGSLLSDYLVHKAVKQQIRSVHLYYLGCNLRASRLIANRAHDLTPVRVSGGLTERLVVPDPEATGE